MLFQDEVGFRLKMKSEHLEREREREREKIKHRISKRVYIIETTYFSGKHDSNREVGNLFSRLHVIQPSLRHGLVDLRERWYLIIIAIYGR